MTKEDNKNEWEINIIPVGGFASSYFSNSYGSYGSKNQALSITDVDLTDVNVLTQGPGATDLTLGNNGVSGVITELVKSILRTATSTNVSFAVGKTLLQKISATAVIDDATWPYTITGTGAITGYDLVHYNGKLLYSFFDATVGGQIGSYNLNATFDDDYWTNTLSGTALQSGVPYYFCVGNSKLFITNGRYVARLDDTTDSDKALDFFVDSVAVSLCFSNNRLKIAFNRPNVTGSNFNNSCVVTWNGVSTSWEGTPVPIPGEIGALYSKNGVDYIWYKDGTDTGGYCFGHLSGSGVDLIRRYSGSLPSHTQVGEVYGFVGWISSNKLILWGAKDKREQVRMFSYMSPKLTTAGGWAVPFGSPLIASNTGSSSYSLAGASGKSVGSSYKTIVFKTSTVDSISQIDSVVILTEPLLTGAKCDINLVSNQAKTTTALTQIAYSTQNKIRWNILGASPLNKIEDFRIDISWANGSTTNDCKIRAILVKGHNVPEN